MFPIDVYYTTKELMQYRVGNADIIVGCWMYLAETEGHYYACDTPSYKDPDRPRSEKENYVAIIAE